MDVTYNLGTAAESDLSNVDPATARAHLNTRSALEITTEIGGAVASKADVTLGNVNPGVARPNLNLHTIQLMDFVPSLLRNDLLSGLLDASDASAMDTAMAQFHAVLAGMTVPPTGELPPHGIIPHTVSLNWAINYLSLRSMGQPRWRYLGSGDHAFKVNAANGVGRMHLDPFIVEGTATALDCVFLRGFGHSVCELIARGAGPTRAGYRIEGGVLSKFPMLRCSGNEDVFQPGYANTWESDANFWFNGAKPRNGLVLAIHSTLGRAAYHRFEQIILEKVSGDGVVANNSIGIIFDGGASEGCGGRGMTLGSDFIRSRVTGVDFEANSGDCDVQHSGHVCQFDISESYSAPFGVKFMAGASNNELVRGLFYGGVSDAGVDNTIEDIDWGLSAQAQFVTNASTRLRGRNRNQSTNVSLQDAYSGSVTLNADGSAIVSSRLPGGWTVALSGAPNVVDITHNGQAADHHWSAEVTTNETVTMRNYSHISATTTALRFVTSSPPTALRRSFTFQTAKIG